MIDAVLTCTHNICFEQKYENSQKHSIENCHFTAMKNRYILHGRVNHFSTAMIFLNYSNTATTECLIMKLYYVHYVNRPLRYAAIFQECKMIILDAKKLIFFLFLLKENVNPCKPQFYYIKVGRKGI